MRFVVTGTDGGWIPASARFPEVTTDVGVGQMKTLEFSAAAPGDWVFHCHKSHHTMNAMGHGIPNTIGVEQRDLAEQISSLVPNYMNMGGEGGAMGEDNASTLGALRAMGVIAREEEGGTKHAVSPGSPPIMGEPAPMSSAKRARATG